ncbi:MAG: dephospho-CoA kinase, partial [Bacteroidota bacterium]
MLKVGLTGNIGSGKSTVARIFSVLQVPVYNADSESKRLL